MKFNKILQSLRTYCFVSSLALSMVINISAAEQAIAPKAEQLDCNKQAMSQAFDWLDQKIDQTESKHFSYWPEKHMVKLTMWLGEDAPLFYCSCSGFNSGKRSEFIKKFVSNIVITFPNKNDQLVLTSLGASGLLMEFFILYCLTMIGYTDITLIVIDDYTDTYHQCALDFLNELCTQMQPQQIHIHTFCSTGEYLAAVRAKQAPASHCFFMVDMELPGHAEFSNPYQKQPIQATSDSIYEHGQPKGSQINVWIVSPIDELPYKLATIVFRYGPDSLYDVRARLGGALQRAEFAYLKFYINSLFKHISPKNFVQVLTALMKSCIDTISLEATNCPFVDLFLLAQSASACQAPLIYEGRKHHAYPEAAVTINHATAEEYYTDTIVKFYPLPALPVPALPVATQKPITAPTVNVPAQQLPAAEVPFCHLPITSIPKAD